MQEIWSKACERLKDKLGSASYENWILPLKPKSQDKNVLILEAPDEFFKEWVSEHYMELIYEAVKNAAKHEIVVEMAVNPTGANSLMADGRICSKSVRPATVRSRRSK